MSTFSPKNRPSAARERSGPHSTFVEQGKLTRGLLLPTLVFAAVVLGLASYFGFSWKGGTETVNPKDLEFLRKDPVPVVEQAQRANAPQYEELPKAVIDQVMAIDGVEGVWLRQEPVGSKAVIVAISKASAKKKVPDTLANLPVEFETTGQIKIQPAK